METLTSILVKKFSQPRFKEAILFAKIKRAVEDFFLNHGARVKVATFEEKQNSLTLTTFHPAQSQELLGSQQILNAFLLKQGLPTVKKIIVTSSRH